MESHNPANPKAVLSIDEFCNQAGIGRKKFYKELNAGRIKAKKSGRRTLIPMTEVMAWFERLPDHGSVAA